MAGIDADIHQVNSNNHTTESVIHQGMTNHAL